MTMQPVLTRRRYLSRDVKSNTCKWLISGCSCFVFNVQWEAFQFIHFSQDCCTWLVQHFRPYRVQTYYDYAITFQSKQSNAFSWNIREWCWRVVTVNVVVADQARVRLTDPPLRLSWWDRCSNWQSADHYPRTRWNYTWRATWPRRQYGCNNWEQL